MSDIYCAFTGAIPDDGEMPIDHPTEDDELSDLPVGWTRLTVQTRTPNPEWETILAVEESMVAQIMEGVPKGQRKAATPGVRVQVAAQLAALKAQTAPYLIQTETFHAGPGDEGAAGLSKLLALLGGEANDGDEEAASDASEAEETDDEAVSG